MTTIDGTILHRVETLFQSNPSYKVQFASQLEMIRLSKLYKHNPKLQRGANLGMATGFVRGWFDQYDWMIRINPDVLIRNSTWLLRQMGSVQQRNIDSDDNNNNNNNGTTTTMAQGIFHRCSKEKLHSDFFAIRPNVLLDYAERVAWKSIQQQEQQLQQQEPVSLNHSLSSSRSIASAIPQHRLLTDREPNETLVQMTRRLLIKEIDEEERKFAIERENEQNEKDEQQQRSQQHAHNDNKKNRRNHHHRRRSRRSQFKGIPTTKEEFDQMYKTRHIPDPLITSTSAFAATTTSFLMTLPVILPFSIIHDTNHESTAAHYFAPMLAIHDNLENDTSTNRRNVGGGGGVNDDLETTIVSPTVAWIPDAIKSKGHCRIRGHHSSIIHEHDYCLAPVGIRTTGALANNTNTNNDSNNTSSIDRTNKTTEYIPICEGLEDFPIT